MFRSGWIGLCICLPFGSLFALAQTNIATANYGNTRANANLNETILTRAAVSGGTFGKLGAFPVDGQIYAQPLYISGLQIPGQGMKNVVFVATMNDSVYAIDADAPASTTPLWQVSLGTAAPSSAIPDLEDVNPQVGILSTPVIDVNAQLIYAVSETFEDGAPVFRLHGLSLANGREMQNGPVVIAASVPGTGGGAVNGAINFDPFWHLQRPGLALANGAVYVAFGSHSDAGNYHGWVMAYNAANLQQQTAVFNSTPNGIGGGIWQSGRAPTIDSAGNVYVVTGNGDFDGAANFSGAVLKLSGSDLSILDWYTPASWQYLNGNDLDVGSTGVILVSGTNLLLAGDKGGRLLNLNTASLGHIESATGVDDFAASPAGIFGLALWQTDQGALLYEHDLSGFLKAYPVSSTAITQTPVATGTWNGDSLYQGMAVSSNGSARRNRVGNHGRPFAGGCTGHAACLERVRSDRTLGQRHESGGCARLVREIRGAASGQRLRLCADVFKSAGHLRFAIIGRGHRACAASRCDPQRRQPGSELRLSRRGFVDLRHESWTFRERDFSIGRFRSGPQCAGRNTGPVRWDRGPAAVHFRESNQRRGSLRSRRAVDPTRGAEWVQPVLRDIGSRGRRYAWLVHHFRIRKRTSRRLE